MLASSPSRRSPATALGRPATCCWTAVPSRCVEVQGCAVREGAGACCAWRRRGRAKTQAVGICFAGSCPCLSPCCLPGSDCAMAAQCTPASLHRAWGLQCQNTCQPTLYRKAGLSLTLTCNISTRQSLPNPCHTWLSQPRSTAEHQFPPARTHPLQTLELVEGSLGTPEGSLLRFLDQAVTPAGHRKVRAWLCSPLYRWV